VALPAKGVVRYTAGQWNVLLDDCGRGLFDVEDVAAFLEQLSLLMVLPAKGVVRYAAGQWNVLLDDCGRGLFDVEGVAAFLEQLSLLMV